MGRGHKKQKGGGGGFEDQYGEGMTSQDRGERPAFSSKNNAFSGGGDAGGGKKDSNLSVIRAVPKFLQGHMHLLGRKPPQEEEEAQLASVDQETELRKEEDDDDKEALEKAVLDNPELADEFPELQPLADRGRANQAKEEGKRAFQAQNFQESVRHFTEAIELHEDPIFYSNRAAAYHALKDYRKAALDARKTVSLDKGWVKGWTRLAAAHFALEEWSEAKEAYQMAVDLEPSNMSLQDMRHKAEVNERKQEADAVFKFKQSRQKASEGTSKRRDSKDVAKRKSLLSFSENEED